MGLEMAVRGDSPCERELGTGYLWLLTWGRISKGLANMGMG